MGSLKMHIAISKKIKEELNYSNVFLIGSILPDIIKLIIRDRKISHFEKDGIINLNEFISKQSDLKNELVVGYYAHLIQDKIWYESYMREKYLKLPEYSDYKLYNDYAFVDNIFYKEKRINTQNISKMLHETIEKVDVKNVCLSDGEIKGVINKEKIRDKLTEIWKDYSSDENNYFYTIQDAVEYYEFSIQKVKEHLIMLNNKQ